MAMTAVYSTVNGQILHEERNGVETEYVPNPLGSVIQTKDVSGTVTANLDYWPYGEERVSSGTNPGPWGFVGTLGYRNDSADLSYVRARHYRPSLAIWITIDPLWPNQRAYTYAMNSPVQFDDKYELAPCSDCDLKGDPCWWYISQFGPPKLDNGDPAAGFIICCQGKCISCVNEF
ncbi:hypothetical protein EON81_15035 [bacterium]|nr:MAG: hypothetical protein EON81_15035 [bacterium]